jgi:hypothetical protein
MLTLRSLPADAAKHFWLWTLASQGKANGADQVNRLLFRQMGAGEILNDYLICPVEKPWL